MITIVTAPQILSDNPPILPKKAPTPELNAVLKSKDRKYSKIIAPKKTPKMEPIIAPITGVKKAPLIAPPIPPIIPPEIPHLEAPYFFAVSAINKYSINSTNITIINNVITKVREKESKFVIIPYINELIAMIIFPGTPKKLDISAAVTAKTNKISKITILLPAKDFW